MQHDSGTYRHAGRPLPPETYRRRRLTVMAALLLTVGLVVWGISAGGSGGTGSAAHPPPPQQEPVAAPQPSAQSSQQGSQKPEPDATVTVTATPKATVTVTATPKDLGEPCRKVEAHVTVRTDKNAYANGSQPTFAVRVKPQQRCLLDPDKLKLEVASGTDRIWSSQDCSGSDQWPRRVTPRMPYKVTSLWERVRSNPAKCDGKPAKATAGWYVLTATLGENSSNEAVFRLK